jgi:iron complex transport system substrate-binding protein
MSRSGTASSLDRRVLISRATRTFAIARRLPTVVVALLAGIGLCLVAPVTTANAESFSIRPATVAHRIVSLSPTATETLFAIGAGHQVVAADADSNYPKNAPRTKLSGLTPSVEAVAKYRPDLVVISYDPNGFAKSLASLGIKVLYQPAALNLDGAYAEIEALGKATGRTVAAFKLVRTMRTEIATTVAEAPHFSSPPSFYYELDPTFYSVTSSTFVGQILKRFGLHDIADRAKGASGGYPQLSNEYIVKSDPRLIFLADTICCQQSLRTVAARPGWRAIRAVHFGDVFGLNDDIASRWGPRVVILAQDVEKALWRYERQRAA